MLSARFVSKVAIVAVRQPIRPLASVAAFLWCAGCVSTPVVEPTISPALSGVWVGEIHWSASFPADDGKTSGSKEIGLINCDGEPEFYWKEDEGYLKSTAKYEYVQNRTTHVLSFVTQPRGDDPPWIETQSWALVEVPPDGLAFSWSRSVNNRLSEVDDPERAFNQVGFGLLRKKSDDCHDTD